MPKAMMAATWPVVRSTMTENECWVRAGGFDLWPCGT
jgi:hypothetical protein